ncbi:MAG: AprI/Inh family metalloprotease inhibitor [Xanthobacteraceae bacterium]|jgi:hypothetical protein
MMGFTHIGRWSVAAVQAAGLMLVLAALAGCASTERLGGSQPEPAVATPPPPPPPPPPPHPPPIDLAGRWKLVASGGSCFMTLGSTPGAAEGTVAPAGGCPGSFFTSRKWTFEHDMLIIRDHKGAVLVELSFADGRFQGKDLNGATITLGH